MQIFGIASSLYNSSVLLQAIASVHYSSGEIAAAYYALQAAASKEGDKISRVQFWQMCIPFFVVILFLLFLGFSFPFIFLLGMAAPHS